MITKEVESLVKLRDAFSMASEALNEYIDTFAPKEQPTETVGLNWNPSSIKWDKADGTSGPYERSEDVNNLDFKAMLKDLAAHQGKLTRDGLFYWVFQNGATVGRKEAKWKK